MNDLPVTDSWGSWLVRSITFILSLLLVLPLTAHGTAPDKNTQQAINVATFMDFPPFISDDEPNGGIVSLIVKKSFEAAGLNPIYSLVPWRRSFRAVMRGEYSASYSWAYSEERARDFELSAPIFSVSNQLLTTYSDIKNWEQLKTPREDGTKPILCVPIGWKVAAELVRLVDTQKMHKVSPGHPRSCMELIRANRTNIVYMPRMTATYHLNAIKAEEEGSTVRDWPDLYTMDVPSGIANTQHVIFTRSAEGAALRDKFDSGFNQLVESGQYREILERYLSGYPVDEQRAIRDDQIRAGILPRQ